MSKAEKFIQDYTRNCSNEMTFEDGSGSHNYVPWLTPDQARRAVEIAREDVIEKVCEFLDNDLCCYIKAQDFAISMIMDFAKQIIINFISDYIKEKGLDTLRVKRTGEYGTNTYDTYQRCKEELFRNGTNVQWTSLGKLYQAYKYIKKK